jgi:hypothetical protein
MWCGGKCYYNMEMNGNKIGVSPFILNPSPEENQWSFLKRGPFTHRGITHGKF